MDRLLEKARRPGWRIWAENSPFELKDELKARGYRWNGDGRPNPKAWLCVPKIRFCVDAASRRRKLAS